MLEWMLVLVTWYGPVEGVRVIDYGIYESHDHCIREMHNAEIAIHATNQSMVCLELVDDYGFRWSGEDAELGLESMQEGFGKGVPGDGSLY
jgi:hypothetical protein